MRETQGQRASMTVAISLALQTAQASILGLRAREATTSAKATLPIAQLTKPTKSMAIHRCIGTEGPMMN